MTIDTTGDLELPPYAGLRGGEFDQRNLPRRIALARSVNQDNVWATAIGMYINLYDPVTDQPHREAGIADAAVGLLEKQTSMCEQLAIENSATCDAIATKRLDAASAATVLAVEHIENANSIMDERSPGPDGTLITGNEIEAAQRADEAIAKQRAGEGDTRHLQSAVPSAWRVIAALTLAVIDIALLWKPLLGLGAQLTSAAVLNWSIGIGMAVLQTVFVEWAMRAYVEAERASVDRRGAARDFNRAVSADPRTTMTAPTRDDLETADRRMSSMFRALLVVAGLVAVLGGVRVAILTRRAMLEVWEAALYGSVIGIIIGGAIILMARVCCRGNALGERLRVEREAMAEYEDKWTTAKATVAGLRQDALHDLNRSKAAADRADDYRRRTVKDYWSAVMLAWIWFQLPTDTLDRENFEQRSTPPSAADESRSTLVSGHLATVNQWLEDRRSRTPVAALAQGPETPVDQQPINSYANRRDVLVRDGRIDVPDERGLPALPIVAAAVVTVVAATVTAFVIKSPDAATVFSGFGR